MFSHWDITDEELTGDPAKYQVWLPGDHYLQPEPNPITDYGFGQFVNCCLRSKSLRTQINGQNMKEAQCEIMYPQRRWVTAEHMKISPAYVRTMRIIKEGEELLFPSGYGGRHKIQIRLFVPCLVTCYVLLIIVF